MVDFQHSAYLKESDLHHEIEKLRCENLVSSALDYNLSHFIFHRFTENDISETPSVGLHCGRLRVSVCSQQ